MRALRWDGKAVRLVERAPPEPAAGEVLLRLRLAGICRTDLEIARGYLDHRGTLGHELVGEVVQGPAAWRGRRVVSEINFPCGSCAACQRGLSRHWLLCNE
ncbi:MAG: alcohol dehydrogenase catalytic domain-containing protein [Deltaproteobacteria bacterium]|nr:alcohol dehydrogenase catalytic domain-containing protein [Deltaproteobacteria bacterium]